MTDRRKGDSESGLSPKPESRLQSWQEETMDSRLNSAFWTLRIAFGGTAFLAGLDKFFNLLTNWEKYASPLVLEIVPLSAGALMRVAGVIEIVAGLALLAGVTRLGGYV